MNHAPEGSRVVSSPTTASYGYRKGHHTGRAPLNTPPLLLESHSEDEAIPLIHARPIWPYLLLTGVFAVALVLAITIAFVLNQRLEDFRRGNEGQPLPGDKNAPDWLKAMAVNPDGTHRYPELHAASQRQKPAVVETGDSPESEKEGSPAAELNGSDARTAEPKTAPSAKTSEVHKDAASDTVEDSSEHGPTHLVKTGDRLDLIGKSQNPRFCGLGSAAKFNEAVVAANSLPAKEGFQALKDAGSIRAGLSIYLPAACATQAQE